jgi:hypothetical protein
MIAYDLKCSNGHVFEGWFDDFRSFQAQQKKGLVTCPFCNDATISRLPSTFSIRSSDAVVPGSQAKKKVDLQQIHSKIVDFVEKNFDNVGTDFAREALKIHYGVTEPRNIRGTSTEKEEEDLRKEGIDFVKIPVPARPEPDA